jgi:hypothetical protein
MALPSHFLFRLHHPSYTTASTLLFSALFGFTGLAFLHFNGAQYGDIGVDGVILHGSTCGGLLAYSSL